MFILKAARCARTLGRTAAVVVAILGASIGANAETIYLYVNGVLTDVTSIVIHQDVYIYWASDPDTVVGTVDSNGDILDANDNVIGLDVTGN